MTQLARPSRRWFYSGLSWLGLAAAVLGFSSTARAVIVYGSQGNNYATGPNYTSVPDGVGSYEGVFGAALGTPIAPRFFVTAYHVDEGGPGSTGFFTYANNTANSTVYDVQCVNEIGNTDLAVWEIQPSDADSFTYYAPLEQSAPALNSPLVVIGRGTARGSAVTGGWAWGSDTGSVSWGTNTVNSIKTFAGPPAGLGGNFIYYTFNATGGSNSNEAILSGGDSGGAIFIQNTVTEAWELAGINSEVDDVSLTSGGSAANYALYDARGYYNGATLISGSNAVPEGSYDAAIYSNYTAIMQAVPEPASGLLLLVSLFPLAAARGWRRSPR